MKTKYFILFFNFVFVLTKTRYLIPDLYLYSIKIKTNIDQNAIKYLQKNHRFLKRIFLKFIFSGWAHPAHVAGLDPASPAWSLAQASDPSKPCTRKILRVHETVRR
jgi:hypothetical protein